MISIKKDKKGPSFPGDSMTCVFKLEKKKPNNNNNNNNNNSNNENNKTSEIEAFKKKKLLNEQETKILMDHFRVNSRPSKSQRGSIAKEIPSMSERAIRVWFQNKRTKLSLTNRRQANPNFKLSARGNRNKELRKSDKCLADADKEVFKIGQESNGYSSLDEVSVAHDSNIDDEDEGEGEGEGEGEEEDDEDDDDDVDDEEEEDRADDENSQGSVDNFSNSGQQVNKRKEKGVTKYNEEKKRKDSREEKKEKNSQTLHLPPSLGSLQQSLERSQHVSFSLNKQNEDVSKLSTEKSFFSIATQSAFQPFAQSHIQSSIEKNRNLQVIESNNQQKQKQKQTNSQRTKRMEVDFLVN